MDDRAHPGQVGPLRQCAFHEVAGEQPHPVRQTGLLHQPPGHGDDFGPVHDGRAGAGIEPEEGNGPCAGGPAQIQQVREPQLAEAGDQRHCHGLGYLVHGPDERGQVTASAQDARAAPCGFPADHDTGQLPPASQAVAEVADHAQHALRPSLGQDLCRRRRDAVDGIGASRLDQETEGGERVQQDLQRSDVPFDAEGQPRRGHGPGMQDREDVQLCRRDDDARRLEPANHVQDRFSILFLFHYVVPYLFPARNRQTRFTPPPPTEPAASAPDGLFMIRPEIITTVAHATVPVQAGILTRPVPHIRKMRLYPRPLLFSPRQHPPAVVSYMFLSLAGPEPSTGEGIG